jgi:hypothetical protein
MVQYNNATEWTPASWSSCSIGGRRRWEEEEEKEEEEEEAL